LIRYCAEGSDLRFGVIPLAISARVSAGIKKEAQSLDDKHWHPIYQEGVLAGNRRNFRTIFGHNQSFRITQENIVYY